ncbi:MAG TPA: hypothetical protein VIK33_07160 [Anaerolineae bacterium]
MSQAATRSPAQRRLRFVGIGLTVLTALVFAGVTAVIYVVGLGQDLGSAVGQGAIWGVGTAIVSIIVYTVYRKAVVKA